MFRPTVAHQAIKVLNHLTHSRAVTAAFRLSVASPFFRPLSSTVPLFKHEKKDPKKDNFLAATTKAPEGVSGEQEGRFARTDKNVKIEYPDDANMPRSPIVQGRGGVHLKRTLAQFSLENKVSLVTGGARGLGLIMAQALVASGSDVDIVDLNKQEAEDQAEKLVEQFQKVNPGLGQMPNITTHYADVASLSVNGAIAEVIQKHSKIDHLVTSASFTENFDAISYPHNPMLKLWGVVVDGTYLFATGVARQLIERNVPGSMVMIGSISGAIVNVPQPQAPYNAAKAAVRHLVSSLAVEWAGHDICVNIINPRYMLTTLTGKILDENPDLRYKWTSHIPIGKMGTPKDLMSAVTFLLIGASRYITGPELRVDGGYTLV
ncbi:uncharacterized protein N7498_011023 [Penicillium cinerascens]|uniref:Uncharacterized protein n=1 Tax=Penicillium cinerascens TaxID=70096 RepID=A0A9W9M7U4_9EURO|nr:uncharacterized protein N7498_011023 [Penicillium cinerascens]KAJ5192038.1 hypothetical protein N7498_011023 [Penicillium cinerascens]